MCNLTREEREFLEKAHIDVEEDDAEENIDNDAAGNTNKEPEVLKCSELDKQKFSFFKHYFRFLI